MSINRVSLYHLETLLWIDRLGTFSAAAERLNTTQPTVSARMRELEQRLGTALFRREGRAMSLTAAGRKLVRDCDPLLRDMQVALLGSGGYGEATAKALPHPTLVADRWRLMDNASRALLNAARKPIRQIRIAIGATTVNPELLTRHKGGSARPPRVLQFQLPSTK